MKDMTAMEKIFKFFSPIKFYKKDFFLHLLQSIFRGLSSIMHIYFVQKIVYALSLSDLILLQKILIFYIISIFSFEFLWFISRKIWWVVTLGKVQTKIYEMYLKKYIKMNNNDVEKMWTWKIIAILENGKNKWADWLVWIIERGTGLIILFIYVFVITVSHWLLYSLWFLCFIIISITILYFVNKRQFKTRYKRTEVINERLRLVTKVLMSKNEILQINKIDSELDKIKELWKNFIGFNVTMANWRMLQNRITPFIIALWLFVFSYVYWPMVISWKIELSEFVWITSIFLVINSSIMSFIMFYIDLTKDFTDIQKMWDFFENTPEIEWYNIWKDFEYKKWDIVLENVTYWYFEEKNVFNNFNIKIKWWEITALVWTSWWWKTTLVKLISWYIKAKKWKIFIDNQLIDEISLKSLYKNIWYLTQEPSVFDWTVLENLTYAIKTEVWEDQIKQIIKQSNCEFIYELQNWINTEIWEKWVRLSWWQKQRLAIAKIMLKDPKIIILDEPTSALDSFSEEQITKAMNNLFIWRTVIIIAHRLQTVKHADNIFVIENWEIIEDWNHRELIKLKWKYKKMLDLQSGF